MRVRINSKKTREKITLHFQNSISNSSKVFKLILEGDENTSKADRPLCEYHTYEWSVSKKVETPSIFYSTPNLKDRLYGTSPIRNIITYLPQKDNLEKQINVLCDGIQPTTYKPNEPNLFLTCFSYDNSLSFPYQICSDLLIKINDNQVIDNLLTEMNQNKLPTIFLEKITEAKEVGIQSRRLITRNKSKFWTIEANDLEGLVFHIEKNINGKLSKTISLYKMTSPSEQSCQIDFFVDKEGYLVVIPFATSHYNELYCASLLVEDALGEEIFSTNGK